MKNKAFLAVFLIFLSAGAAIAQTDAQTDAQTEAQTADTQTADPGAINRAEALSGYSPWSYFGGLNLVVNSNGSGVSFVGINTDGTSGGLSSAPSPIAGFLGAEYRYPLKRNVLIAPSVSLYTLRYLWAEDRALPAEIENRTAFVPTILLDCPFLYHVEKNRFLFSFGGGPGIVLRYGFLESDVGKDEISYSEDMSAGDQVKEINKYLWSSLRWFYPMLEGNVRYRLDNGWGAGATLRIGIPVFNLWAKGDASFLDSSMILAALVFTPPAKKMADSVEESADSKMLPSVKDQPIKDRPTATKP